MEVVELGGGEEEEDDDDDEGGPRSESALAGISGSGEAVGLHRRVAGEANRRWFSAAGG